MPDNDVWAHYSRSWEQFGEPSPAVTTADGATPPSSSGNVTIAGQVTRSSHDINNKSDPKVDKPSFALHPKTGQSHNDSEVSSSLRSAKPTWKPRQTAQPERVSVNTMKDMLGGSNDQTSPAVYQAALATATSTWSSTFSSRIANLRKALTKDSEDDDPEYEDASHISHSLRAYYTEKGRDFPEWLPPDPKKHTTVPKLPQDTYSASHGGLADLWDSSPAPAHAAGTQDLAAALERMKKQRGAVETLTPKPIPGATSDGIDPSLVSVVPTHQIESKKPQDVTEDARTQGVDPNRLAHLGAQGTRMHNTDRNLDTASSQTRNAEDKQSVTRKLDRSMFAVYVNEPAYKNEKTQGLVDEPPSEAVPSAGSPQDPEALVEHGLVDSITNLMGAWTSLDAEEMQLLSVIEDVSAESNQEILIDAA